MSDKERKALIYYYLKMKEQMPFLHGLKYKSCYQFVRLIEDLGDSIEKNRVLDFDAITKGAL